MSRVRVIGRRWLAVPAVGGLTVALAGCLGLAVQANAYVYWTANSRTFGRANLNGTGANQRFITGADSPDALAIDSEHVYWANFGNGTIGRTNLNGTDANQGFLTARGHPRGVAVDSGS